MIKKEIYPKTKRVSCLGDKVYITEKLDGSNLVIFKKNDKLYFAQRKNIMCIEELEESKDILYKGLYQWLNDNKEILENELYNDSAICGEWLVQDLIDCGVNKRNIDLFTSFEGMHYGIGFSIESFILKHDVPNCGWKLMFDNGYSYFYATDTCSLDGVEVKNFDMYFIEGNYEDKAELELRKQKHIENGEYYYEDRVEKTHLSQIQALDWLMQNMGEKSQYIFMHEHKEKESGKEVKE